MGFRGVWGINLLQQILSGPSDACADGVERQLQLVGNFFVGELFQEPQFGGFPVVFGQGGDGHADGLAGLVPDVGVFRAFALAVNAFFHIFNHLHMSGKQLILTCDRPPVELQGLEARLLSRFKWGLTAELTKPDYKTRLAILKAKCSREGIALSEDVLHYLASAITSNVRELEGSLISLMANATLMHRPITVELARTLTGALVPTEEKEELTMAKIPRHPS